MVHSVIPYLVTIIMDAAHQVWIEIGPITRDKEGRMDMMFGQDIEYTRGRSGWPTCIECQCDTRSAGIPYVYFHW
jgi:hypothetical protein